MRYIVTDGGIQFIDEPIPLDIAIKSVEAIAAKQREALENAIRPNAAAPVDTGAEQIVVTTAAA